MALVGADVEALAALSTTMKNRADQVGAIATELNNSVQGVTWTGNDATKFRSQWGQVSKALAGLQAMLAENSTAIGRNAEEQRNASAN